MLNIILKQTSGMAAIITVVVIGVVALLVVKSTASFGIDALSIGYNTAKAGEAMALAEGCADETFRRWQLDTNYSAADLTINLDNGQCQVNATGSGTVMIMRITGQVNNYFKHIYVEASRASGTPIAIDTWEEVSE